MTSMQAVSFSVLMLITPVAFCAEEAQCHYKASFVKEAAVTDSSVALSHWSTERDRKSDEYIKRLYLVYKNGDIAVIEHKYCDMYNFEVSYAFYSQNPAPTSQSIGQIIAKHAQYAQLTPSYSPSLSSIVTSELEKNAFDGQKPLSLGLPQEPLTFDDFVEYSVSFLPNKESNILQSSLSFYMGIGGAD
ncbi:hypothetical protein ONV78_04240 [Hahella sp. CR1]|uniref:hypothetical protein n=1 Tax=Hahella sp. CR1 TaxID=2992807 RepID=UPI0024411893|nr:hypothetical protein [Hahella sp. CR1]MDG9666936.1 hypothetical protein [Hahella sp. CR1]